MPPDDTTPMTPEEGAPSVPTAPPPAAPDTGPMMNMAMANENPATAPLALPYSSPAVTVQPTSAPPTADSHLSWIGRVLDKVGSILGGNETYRLKKQPDGSFEISQDPSTTGEKWGRIAAAALGGAAQGLANSQGPGGLARATAAGIQYGMQKPQQDRQQQEQQANFQNQQLLSRANRIHLTQETYMLAQQAKLVGAVIDQKSAETLANWENTLLSSPNAQDLGPIDPSDPNAAMNAAKKNPAAMDAFLGKSNQVLRPVYAPDHKLHMILTDRSWEERRNTVPMEMFHIGKDDKGNAALVTENVPVNGAPVQKIMDNNQAVQLKLTQMKKDEAAATKDLRDTPDKPLDTSAKTYDAWRQETDPVKKAGLWTQYQQQLKDEIQKRAVTHVSVGGAAPAQGSLENWATLLENPQSGITMAQVPPKMRTAVVDYMGQNGRQPAIKLGGDELKRMDLANIALQNLKDARDVLDSRPDLFGPKGFLKKTFADWIKGGDPDAHKFQMAITQANLPLAGIHGVRGKYAVDDLAKEDSDLYHNADAMGEILDEATRSATQISQSGGRKIAPRAGAAPAAAPSAAPAAQQQNAVPPGARPGRNKAGEVVGYQDATGWHSFNK